MEHHKEIQRQAEYYQRQADQRRITESNRPKYSFADYAWAALFGFMIFAVPIFTYLVVTA